MLTIAAEIYTVHGFLFTYCDHLPIKGKKFQLTLKVAHTTDPYGVCTLRNCCQGDVITHYPSREATDPGAAICSAVFSEMKVTDSAAGKKTTLLIDTRLEPSPSLPPTGLGRVSQRFPVLFGGVLWGLSSGHEGARKKTEPGDTSLPSPLTYRWEEGDVIGWRSEITGCDYDYLGQDLRVASLWEAELSGALLPLDNLWSGN